MPDLRLGSRPLRPGPNNKQTYDIFSLLNLPFGLCSFHLEVVRAQRITGFFKSKLPINQRDHKLFPVRQSNELKPQQGTAPKFGFCGKSSVQIQFYCVFLSVSLYRVQESGSGVSDVTYRVFDTMFYLLRCRDEWRDMRQPR